MDSEIIRNYTVVQSNFFALLKILRFSIKKVIKTIYIMEMTYKKGLSDKNIQDFDLKIRSNREVFNYQRERYVFIVKY